MAEINVDRVTKKFGVFTAVKDMDIRFADGEVTCLLGPSGCGKTTLMRMIAGLERPTSGRVLFGGRDVTALPTHARNVGMVFQYPVMYPTLSVAENIALPLKQDRSVSAAERDRRVSEMLDVLDMRDLGSSFIDELDAGNRQKVAVGRAIARRSDIVLFDEPHHQPRGQCQAATDPRHQEGDPEDPADDRLCDARPDRSHDPGR